MLDALYITMITRLPLRTALGLELLTTAFESVPALTPTHWAPGDPARRPYDHHDIITTVSSYKNDAYSPSLRRAKPLRYNAFFTAYNDEPNDVQIDCRSAIRARDVPPIFALGEALAAALEPDLGLIHLSWDEGERAQAYDASSAIKARDLHAFGPRALTARTWLGRHLVDLIGRARLEDAGLIAQDTAWGGVVVDLVPKLWETDFDTLASRQQEVMSILAPSGVFGDYGDSSDPKRGPCWTPFPDAMLTSTHASSSPAN